MYNPSLYVIWNRPLDNVSVLKDCKGSRDTKFLSFHQWYFLSWPYMELEAVSGRSLCEVLSLCLSFLCVLRWLDSLQVYSRYHWQDRKFWSVFDALTRFSAPVFFKVNVSNKVKLNIIITEYLTRWVKLQTVEDVMLLLWVTKTRRSCTTFN